MSCTIQMLPAFYRVPASFFHTLPPLFQSEHRLEALVFLDRLHTLEMNSPNPPRNIEISSSCLTNQIWSLRVHVDDQGHLQALRVLVSNQHLGGYFPCQDSANHYQRTALCILLFQTLPQ